MNDNDIVKALMCCKDAECLNCPRWTDEWYSGQCNDFLQDVLDLINRLKAEIERYEKEDTEKFNKWLKLDERTRQRYSELYEEAKDVVRSEAIKEFAERLKQSAFACDVSFGYGRERCTEAVSVLDIDNIVKEMKEGK